MTLTAALADLTVSYPRATAPVLADITLDIEPGEFVLLLGPSGCGKSTLTLCLNGIVPHSVPARKQGRVRLGGVDVAGRHPASFSRHVAFVFQDADSQFCTLTVEDEIAFALENQSVDPVEIDRAIDRALNLVGLPPAFRRRALRTLSGGEKQKVSLAACLAQDAALYVFDEATASLDPAAARHVHGVIARLRAERPDVAILLVDHGHDDLLPLVDRVVVLGRDGRVAVNAPPAIAFGDHVDTLRELGLRVPLPSATLDAPATIRGAPTPGAPLVTLRDIGYDTPEGPPILNGVSIEVRRGETLALVGRNGAGKSTLAAAIAGLIETNRGDRRQWGDRFDVAYAFQNPEHQFIANSVREELLVRLCPDRRMRAAPEFDVQARSMLDRLGLAHLAGRHPFSLSQGEKRRLAILAAVTGHNADLMVLDEPSHALDAAGIESVIALVSELRTPARAIVLVSHDMDLVWRMADRVAVLSHGEIIVDAPVDAAFADAAILEAAGLGLPSHLRRSSQP